MTDHYPPDAYRLITGDPVCTACVEPVVWVADSENRDDPMPGRWEHTADIDAAMRRHPAGGVAL
jgi:hypothetical protein